MSTPEVTGVSALVSAQLPYLRRYARALTGSQSSGDQYAIATLEAVLADPASISAAPNPRVALFRVFHTVWSSTGTPVAELGADPPVDAAVHEALPRPAASFARHFCTRP